MLRGLFDEMRGEFVVDYCVGVCGESELEQLMTIGVTRTGAAMENPTRETAECRCWEAPKTSLPPPFWPILWNLGFVWARGEGGGFGRGCWSLDGETGTVGLIQASSMGCREGYEVGRCTV